MKKAQSNRRPTPRRLCNMYQEFFAHDNERITDPVEYAKASVEHLAKWFCKTGLLKPASNVSPCWKPTEPPPRPFWQMPKGKRIENLDPAEWNIDTFWHTSIGNRCYYVRMPCQRGEEMMVNELRELSHRAYLAFPTHYASRNLEKAVWEFGEIRALIERVCVLTYDSEVGKGRERKRIETEWHRKGTEQRKLTPARAADILAKLKKPMSHQAIVNAVKCSKKTVQKVKQAAIRAGKLAA